MLRPYQQRAIDEYHRQVSHGQKRILLNAPTGAGKTEMAKHGMIVPAMQAGQVVWFAAPRRQLIHQTSNHMTAAGFPEHGIIMGSHWRNRPFARLQVASVPTLANRLEKQIHKPDLIIVDECHHVTSDNQLGKIIEAYPDAVIAGLTATPCRLDGNGLGNVFSSMITVATIGELIEQGYLVRPKLYIKENDIGLAKVAKSRGDYNQRQLGELARNRKLVGNIVKQWLTSGEGQPTVCFAVNVAHSLDIVAKFNQAGVPAAHIDAKTPDAERERLIRELELGVIKVLSSVGVFTEGFDLPAVGCVIFARPTESLSLYIQMAGRGLRPKNKTAAPGEYCIFLDHACLTTRHGLITDDRHWSLETGCAEEKESQRECPKCLDKFTGNPLACPSCGHALRTIDDEGEEQTEVYIPEGDDTELQEYSEAVAEKSLACERRKKYAKWAEHAKANGWNAASVRVRFKEVFGEYPTDSDVEGQEITIDWDRQKRKWVYAEKTAQLELAI